MLFWGEFPDNQVDHRPFFSKEYVVRDAQLNELIHNDAKDKGKRVGNFRLL